MEVTFENMPKMLAEINRKIDYLLKVRQETEADRLMNIVELIQYLPEHPARQTVYGWINNRQIPYVKHGKRLFFRKSEIETWLSNGRKLTLN